MERLFFEVALRATLIGAAAGFTIWAMRIRGAAARHTIWTGVVLVMLLLPLWTAWGPKAALKVLPLAQPAADISTASPAQAGLPLAPGQVESHPMAPIAAAGTGQWRNALFAIYLLGVIVLAGRLLLGSVQIGRASCRERV